MARAWHTLQDEWGDEALESLHDLTPQPAEQTLGGRLRQIAFYVVIVAVFAVFVGRLWQLQVTERAYWADRAEKNRSRYVSLPAPRGIIYDRYGVPLVHNVPRFIVTITPGYLPEDEQAQAQVYNRLSELLDMPVTASDETTPTVKAGIRDLVDRATNPKDPINYSGPYRPVIIKTGVERDVALIIMEELHRLPGVQVEIDSVREYPQGPIFAPIIGYMTKIPSNLVDDYKARGYDPATDLVGMAGIEYTAETQLRGKKGEKYIEEDVAGRQVRVVEQTDPLPGNSVYLSIDAGLQVAAFEALQAELDAINRYYDRDVTQRGAVIAMNPQTGEVLAMVSLPSYDNNLFAQGVSWPDYHQQLEALLTNPHRPLLNHAIADRVQPGSTFKIIVASAGLQEGVITPKTKIFDPGTIVIPNKYFPNDPGHATRFSCWNKAGHGYLDIIHALAESCNIFFYETGGGLDVPDQPKFQGLGEKRLVKYARLFGLGRPTGVDLPGEAGGHIPTATWKRLTFGENWSTGDTYNFSIGEGYLEVTPIQMLNAAAAIANGGTLYQPQILHHVETIDGRVVSTFRPKTISQTLPISSTHLALVRQGMELAVTAGTSTKAQVPGVRVAGKTGTAEFCDDMAQQRGLCYPGRWPTHAWFIAFAPADNPEIALVVYIWNGGEGSERAVPVAKKILDYYFTRPAPTSQ